MFSCNFNCISKDLLLCLECARVKKYSMLLCYCFSITRALFCLIRTGYVVQFSRLVPRGGKNVKKKGHTPTIVYNKFAVFCFRRKFQSVYVIKHLIESFRISAFIYMQWSLDGFNRDRPSMKMCPFQWLRFLFVQCLEIILCAHKHTSCCTVNTSFTSICFVSFNNEFKYLFDGLSPVLFNSFKKLLIFVDFRWLFRLSRLLIIHSICELNSLHKLDNIIFLID